jgi:hypothetical protein
MKRTMKYAALDVHQTTTVASVREASPAERCLLELPVSRHHPPRLPAQQQIPRYVARPRCFGLSSVYCSGVDDGTLRRGGYGASSGGYWS